MSESEKTKDAEERHERQRTLGIHSQIFERQRREMNEARK
jgi:hypothetical protein